MMMRFVLLLCIGLAVGCSDNTAPTAEFITKRWDLEAEPPVNMVQGLDGELIRIPGFVVPLEFNEQQAATQFFLVPYYGACIHMPPPPPNQIILVNYPQGFSMEYIDEPIWASGLIEVGLRENEIAESAYTMNMLEFEIYQYSDAQY